MGAATPERASTARERRRRTNDIKALLREMRNQLSLLHHHVSARVELKDVDLDCYELLTRHGPMTASALARRAGLHPATMTGVIDRLQRGGWVVRDRDPEAPDRRTVTVRALPERRGEVGRLYAGMGSSIDEICAAYSEPQLELLADFLRRTTEAGRDATDELGGA